MSIDILDPEQTQVMVDIETLGRTYNSVIVSIGATKFTLKEGVINTFEINIDPADSRKLGLVIEKDTVDWWKNQPKEISNLWRVNPYSLQDSMTKFVKFYGPVSLPFWCRGLNFDEPIIKSNLAAVGLPTPWKYNDVNDLRTLTKLIKIPAENKLAAHGALNDAINQTNHIIAILQ